MLGQVTLGSKLDTLDLLRSSANLLNPGEGESSAGLGKGSVIPNFALTASDRAVTSGSSDRPCDPEFHRWAPGEEDPDSFQELLKLSAGEAGTHPRGNLWVTWGVYLCAGKPPLADIVLSPPPDLTRCDSVMGLAIPAMSSHIQYRGAAG